MDSLMETSLPQEPVALRGTSADLNGSTECHAPSGSLFQNEPLVMRKRAKPLFRQWLHGLLLGGNIKRLGSRIFQRERREKNAGRPAGKRKPNAWVEGDPENDRVALERILLGKNGRHLSMEWLDDLAAEFGSEGKRAIVEFICDRYGYQMPLPVPDPIADQERRKRIEERMDRAVALFEEVRAEILAGKDGAQ